MEEFLRNNPNLLNNNINTFNLIKILYYIFIWVNNNISKIKSLQKQLSFNSGQIGPQPFMVARFGKKKVIP